MTYDPTRQTICLQPSPVHGIGVFAVVNFKVGEFVPLFNPEVFARRIKDPTDRMRMHVVELEDGEFAAPQNWNAMDMGWFVNHSESPNVEEGSLFALRDIAAGEELFLNYLALGSDEHTTPQETSR